MRWGEMLIMGHSFRKEEQVLVALEEHILVKCERLSSLVLLSIVRAIAPWLVCRAGFDCSS